MNANRGIAKSGVAGLGLGNTAADSEGTLRFAELTGRRPMIETYRSKKAAEAYARVMSGDATVTPVGLRR